MQTSRHFAAWEQPELLSNEISQYFLTDCGLEPTFARSIVMKMKVHGLSLK